MRFLRRLLNRFRRKPPRLKLDLRDDYWREAAMCALEEHIDLERFQPGEWDSIAKSLAGSAEHVGMAFGEDCIPNPRDTEIGELKAKLKAAAKHHDAREEAWGKAVKDRLRLRHTDQVWLSRDGELESR